MSGKRIDGAAERAGYAIIGRAESAEGGPAHCLRLALRVGEESGVIADGQGIAQDAQADSHEMARAKQLLGTIGNIHAIDDERDTLPGGSARCDSLQLAQLLLSIADADHRIVHFADEQAPLAPILFTFLD